MDNEQSENTLKDHNPGTSGDDVIQEIRDLVLNGSFEKAIELRKESAIDEEKLLKILNDTIDSYKDIGEYKEAVQIADLFKITGKHIENLYIAEWKRLHAEKKFEEAAQWASDRGMADTEVRRSATLAYENFLTRGSVEDAFRMMDLYALKKEDLLSLTIDEFNKAYAQAHFFKAALLGERFNFSKERTISSSIKACMKCIAGEEIDKAMKMIADFNLISNSVFESVNEIEANKFLDGILEKFIRPSIEKGKFKAVVDFAENSKIINQNFVYIPLKEFLNKFQSIIANTHNHLLENLEEKPARFLRDAAGLMQSDFPRELYKEVVKAAEKYHNNLLDKGDLQKALNFKEEYGLYSKTASSESIGDLHQHVSKFIVKYLNQGDIGTVRIIIKEYPMPDIHVNTAVIAGIMGLLDKNNHDKAFEVLSSFDINISDEESRIRVTQKYKELMGQKKYLLAMMFAKNFHLSRPLIEEASYRAWEEKFLEKKFDEAFELKKQNKVPKKRMIPVATSFYRAFMEEGDYKLAVHVRRTYNVKISIMEWMVEFFKLIFTK
ncbi:hypothetical protein ACFL6G_00065 [candidate division KSB1 bacterium]